MPCRFHYELSEQSDAVLRTRHSERSASYSGLRSSTKHEVRDTKYYVPENSRDGAIDPKRTSARHSNSISLTLKAHRRSVNRELHRLKNWMGRRSRRGAEGQILMIFKPWQLGNVVS